jgi:hypothetical protein
VEPEDAALLTEALRGMLARVDVGHRQHNVIARAYAEQNLDKQRVLERFEADLETLMETGAEHG